MRVLRAGPRGLLVEVGSAAEALHAEIIRRGIQAEEIVPAAGTVLLDGLDDPDSLAAELPHWDIPALPADEGPLVEVPVVYDGTDLAEVAALWDVPVDEVSRVHSARPYRVAFCGFAPGFAYLSGLPERYQVPRRSTPRTSVPAGAVGLAGSYTGVYPRPSPGGWQLIGRTDLVLWDAAAEPAALLSPGTRVRFRPVAR